MAATFLISTPDGTLGASWARQLPTRPIALGHGNVPASELNRPGARVWIRDVRDGFADLPVHPDTVVVVVGQPQSHPFEEAKRNPRTDQTLSYEESTQDLGRTCNLAARLAEQKAISGVLSASRSRRSGTAPAQPADTSTRFPEDLWFLEASIHYIEDTGRVIEEFVRGVRARLRAARVTIFLPDEQGFIAKAEKLECSRSHPLVVWLQENATVIDASILETIDDSAAVSAINQKMGEWRCSLLVPMEVGGTLGGWMALGARTDGRSYSVANTHEATMLMTVFARLIEKQRLLAAASVTQRDAKLMERYGPQSKIIGTDRKDEEGLPVEVREVVAAARKVNAQVEREFGTLRVLAGSIAETGGVWVIWGHSELTADSTARTREVERYALLHDMGIILSHELSNRWFSIQTFVKALIKKGTSDFKQEFVEQVNRDMERMKQMPHIFATLHEMAKRAPALVDMNTVVNAAAIEVNAKADLKDPPPTLMGHEDNLRQALVWFCDEIKDASRSNGPQGQATRLVIRVQQRRRDSDSICLVTIACPGLRLEQIRAGDAKSVAEYPTLPVFLAQQVVRYHFGTVDVSQGVDGPELMITLRSLDGKGGGSFPKVDAPPVDTGTLKLLEGDGQASAMSA